MSQITLKTRVGETDIYVPGSMDTLHGFLSGKNRNSGVILLVDENVLNFHGEKLTSFPSIPIPEGENSKSLENYSRIFQQLLDMGVDRSWTLVGIGGGITTDLAGFVASTYFRGLNFGYISTTLLGQVDASIGGKNGINYKGFKNLIGVIRQPDFVFCDIQSLNTLPEKEFKQGFSEIIKYAFIRRPDMYRFLEDNLDKAIDFDADSLEYLIRESINTKVDIVKNDEFEQGDRKLLNFGHTFGHALEKLYHISHGEAVSVGMLMATKLSVSLNLISQDVYDKLEALLKTAGLPLSMDYVPEEMAEAMLKDKKRKGSGIGLVLLKDLGDAFIYNVSLDELKPLLYDLR